MCVKLQKYIVLIFKHFLRPIRCHLNLVSDQHTRKKFRKLFVYRITSNSPFPSTLKSQEPKTFVANVKIYKYVQYCPSNAKLGDEELFPSVRLGREFNSNKIRLFGSEFILAWLPIPNRVKGRYSRRRSPTITTRANSDFCILFSNTPVNIYTTHSWMKV